MAIKHAREAAVSADGIRVLVERRWPPGKRRDDIGVDLWLRDAAPSDALSRWYRAGEREWDDFVWRYRAEIARQRELVRLLHELGRRGPVTLLHAARDRGHNNAVALKAILDDLG